VNDIIGAVIVFAGWIFSICLHEFGHAVVAYWGGDSTVKDKGYLTFNPLRYTDPGLSIVIPIIFLLLGGVALPGAAVYINQSLLRNNFWRSLVSVAGPLMSLVAAVLFSLPTFLTAEPNSFGMVLMSSCVSLTLLNVIAFMLNILPVPGLDGYGVIEPWLPAFIRQPLKQFSGAGMFLLFALLWMNASANRLFWDTGMSGASAILRMPPQTVSSCFDHFLAQKNVLVVVAIVGFVLMKLFQSKSGSNGSS
jgi:Zn-dependent protease